MPVEWLKMRNLFLAYGDRAYYNKPAWLFQCRADQ
jgi:hypothetical protein